MVAQLTDEAVSLVSFSFLISLSLFKFYFSNLNLS
jgi:low temperature requirement protein LtrA